MVDTGGTRTPRRSWLARWILIPTDNWLVRNSTRFVIVTALLLLIFALLSPMMLYNISPGQVGVIWRRFGGTDVDHYLMEGLQVVYPWDRVYKYETRLQREEKTFEVLSEDGLAIAVRIAWRYSINPKNAPLLHQYIGPKFSEILIAPDIAERARAAFAQNTPEDIWTNRRVAIQSEMLAQVREHITASFNPPGFSAVDFVHLEDILVTGLSLPKELQQSIIRKNVENQRQQEMDYRLLYERKEAERKGIEATGVRQFQDVVSYGLTNSYLQWRGIEATLELAKSNNAKIVVIGNSSNGLPLILGGADKDSPTVPGAADLRLPRALEHKAMQETAALEKREVESRETRSERMISWFRHVWSAVKGDVPSERHANATGTETAPASNTGAPEFPPPLVPNSKLATP
jgi:prohibitin 1